MKHKYNNIMNPSIYISVIKKIKEYNAIINNKIIYNTNNQNIELNKYLKNVVDQLKYEIKTNKSSIHRIFYDSIRLILLEYEKTNNIELLLTKLLDIKKCIDVIDIKKEIKYDEVIELDEKDIQIINLFTV